MLTTMAKTKTFSIPDEETDAIEIALKKLRGIDLWSESKIIVESIKEYAHRHLPGNPQLVIPNFIPELKTPLSVAALEKLSTQNPVGMKKWSCQLCEGSGKFHGETCPTCSGYGYYYSGKGATNE
jgi:hypothetical protein